MNKRGRPKTGVTPICNVRMPLNLLEALDKFRVSSHPEMTRSEIVRMVVIENLRNKGYLK